MLLTVRDVEEAFKLLGYLDAGLKAGDLAVFVGAAYRIPRRVIQKYEDANDCKSRVRRDIDCVVLTTPSRARIEFRPVGDSTKIRDLEPDVVVVVGPRSVPEDLMCVLPTGSDVIGDWREKLSPASNPVDAQIHLDTNEFDRQMVESLEKINESTRAVVDSLLNNRDLVQLEPAVLRVEPAAQPPCRLTVYDRDGGDITIEGPDPEAVAAIYKGTK